MITTDEMDFLPKSAVWQKIFSMRNERYTMWSNYTKIPDFCVPENIVNLKNTYVFYKRIPPFCQPANLEALAGGLADMIDLRSYYFVSSIADPADFTKIAVDFTAAVANQLNSLYLLALNVIATKLWYELADFSQGSVPVDYAATIRERVDATEIPNGFNYRVIQATSRLSSSDRVEIYHYDMVAPRWPTGFIGDLAGDYTLTATAQVVGTTANDYVYYNTLFTPPTVAGLSPGDTVYCLTPISFTYGGPPVAIGPYTGDTLQAKSGMNIEFTYAIRNYSTEFSFFESSADIANIWN